MTSYGFEVAAKNIVIEHNRENLRNYGIEDINMVWFGHILGYKKAILIDNGANNIIYEVTYNDEKEEFYLDEYEKNCNKVFHESKVDKNHCNNKLVRNNSYECLFKDMSVDTYFPPIKMNAIYIGEEREDTTKDGWKLEGTMAFNPKAFKLERIVKLLWSR